MVNSLPDAPNRLFLISSRDSVGSASEVITRIASAALSPKVPHFSLLATLWSHCLLLMLQVLISQISPSTWQSLSLMQRIVSFEVNHA